MIVRDNPICEQKTPHIALAELHADTQNQLKHCIILSCECQTQGKEREAHPIQKGLNQLLTTLNFLVNYIADAKSLNCYGFWPLGISTTEVPLAHVLSHHEITSDCNDDIIFKQLPMPLGKKGGKHHSVHLRLWTACLPCTNLGKIQLPFPEASSKSKSDWPTHHI